MGPSRFDTVHHAEPDSFRQMLSEFAADKSPKKISLAGGMFWDEEGKIAKMDVVEKATKQLGPHIWERHGYLPTQGHASFIRQAQNLVFSEQLVQSCLSGIGPRLTSFQTVGGTGANHLGTLFLARNLRPRRVWIPHQTWEGHSRLWQRASDFGSRGQEALELRFYPYHDATNNCLDFQGMIGVLEQESEPDDILLLHACAHNPTGIDPSREQWEAIANFCSARNIFPFFDMAYQGFASGSFDDDAWAIRHFVHGGHELCVAQTFSKSMFLYGERLGALHLVTGSTDAAARAQSQLSRLQRDGISSPPAFGANVASEIMSNPELRGEWQREVGMIHKRVMTIRKALVEELTRLGTPGEWDYIEKQVGMFTCTNLTLEQIDLLKTRYHIYVRHSGRLSIAALANRAAVTYVATALDTVVRETSKSHRCRVTIPGLGPRDISLKTSAADALPSQS